uniref:Uncharacterized protein n=1 Tax=Sphaerodactylus townsendi TaxID=933632 RepID=A0ACB8F4A8_9SAUR
MAATRAKNGGNNKTPDKSGSENYDKLEQMIGRSITLQEETKERLNKLDCRFGTFEKEIQEIKKEMSQVKKMEESIKEIKNEVINIKNNVTVTDSKVEIFKNQMEMMMDQMALQELRQKEDTLRFRGCKEENKENLREKMTTALAEFLGMEESI